MPVVAPLEGLGVVAQGVPVQFLQVLEDHHHPLGLLPQVLQGPPLPTPAGCTYSYAHWSDQPKPGA